MVKWLSPGVEERTLAAFNQHCEVGHLSRVQKDHAVSSGSGARSLDQATSMTQRIRTLIDQGAEPTAAAQGNSVAPADPFFLGLVRRCNTHGAESLAVHGSIVARHSRSVGANGPLSASTGRKSIEAGIGPRPFLRSARDRGLARRPGDKRSPRPVRAASSQLSSPLNHGCASRVRRWLAAASRTFRAERDRRVSVSGRRDAKSRAALLSASIASIDLSPIGMRTRVLY
jgi:hypothetical protein